MSIIGKLKMNSTEGRGRCAWGCLIACGQDTDMSPINYDTYPFH